MGEPILTIPKDQPEPLPETLWTLRSARPAPRCSAHPASAASTFGRSGRQDPLFHPVRQKSRDQSAKLGAPPIWDRTVLWQRGIFGGMPTPLWPNRPRSPALISEPGAIPLRYQLSQSGDWTCAFAPPVFPRPVFLDPPRFRFRRRCPNLETCRRQFDLRK